MAQDLDNIANKNKITILDQYHSALEHTFLWTVDAESAQHFMIELQWSAFNALEIFPLGRYQNVVEACKKLDAA